jgi:LmbE family N-acetylglucosaminyl deacetylase
MTNDELTAEFETGAPVVVLSPHLDDAVLSCGALLTHAHDHAPVTVATLFTRSGPPPYTLSARRYLRLTGASDAEKLYAARRAEDREVLERMGVAWRHLSLPDGLFRNKPGCRAATHPWARRIPELARVYPTYRLHLVSGKMSPHDASTLQQVADALALLASGTPGPVLAPLAVGGHVDHLLVRIAAECSGRRVVYYSEFPYNRRHAPDSDFVRRNSLTEAVWSRGIAEKSDLIRAYRTQCAALFPGGRVPPAPEVYLLPRGPRADRAAPAGGP